MRRFFYLEVFLQNEKVFSQNHISLSLAIEKELMVILKLFPKKLKPSDIFTGGSLQVTVIKQ